MTLLTTLYIIIAVEALALLACIVRIIALRLTVARRQAQLDSQREAFGLAKEELDARWRGELQTLRLEFQESAGRIMEERAERLDAVNQRQMRGMLEPFRERIRELQMQMEESRKSGAALGATVTEQLKGVQDNARRMASEADRLANALRMSNRVQGNWGELQLEQALVDCGLVKDVNFRLQAAITDAQGNAYAPRHGEDLKPDATVLFPDGRRLFIDSKTCFTDYSKYLEAKDDAARATALRAHLDSVKAQIRNLASKRYPEIGNLAIPGSTFEYTIMFMGNEGGLLLALSNEPTLWEDAFRNQRVILVSRLSLYPLLWLVNRCWQAERQSRNQANIMAETVRLIERLDAYVKRVDCLGKRLADAQCAYDDARAFLCDSPKGVVRTGGRIASLMGRATLHLNVTDGQGEAASEQ